jgi:hypothetical protein
MDGREFIEFVHKEIPVAKGAKGQKKSEAKPKLDKAAPKTQTEVN